MASDADDGCTAFLFLISFRFGTHSYPSLFYFTNCTVKSLSIILKEYLYFNSSFSYCCTCGIQLFEKGCRKECTRQSRKVLWVVLSSLFFKEIWKNGTRGHGCMFARAKGKQQKQVRQLQCQEQCIDHFPYYLSGLSRALFSDNLSWNCCILLSLVVGSQWADGPILNPYLHLAF